jgi:FCP1-like phosphatase family protein
MRRKRAGNAGGSERGRSGELSRARLLFPGDHGGTVLQWNVAVGQSFEARDVLARCLCDSLRGDRKPLLDLVAPYDGTVLSLEYAAGARVPAPQSGGADAAGAAQTVARISYCMHDIILAGFALCGVCGRKPSQLSGTVSGSRFEQEAGAGSEGTSAGAGGAAGAAGAGPTVVDPDSISATAASMTVNVGGGNAIMVSRSEAEGERRRMLERLFRTRKLLLVLDIDHTMLHATDDVRAPAFAQGKQLGAELHSFKMPASEDHTMPDKVHHVMMRPGLVHWLERLAVQYELYIYTAGTRTYAEAVAKIFDPQGRLFGSRIISRTDVPELGKVKRLERFFPIDNSMVLAVDDRSDVADRRREQPHQNEYIGLELLEAFDVGGSIAIHTFGALFGLACSKTMNLSVEKAKSSYTGDIFSMIGTMFLFIYWPSFNCLLALGPARVWAARPR